ncbi:hypothetical protein HFO56_01170 [Rhizobium laguerreae]|uniref:hypothetical protein n=1 Tax=Rhizobium laguerreae TaxID=1076926 RepID=UPI001C9298D3|nr:hypothetical protein [Rhizobium laguerreae]MBY3151038.1 hypothetical protein [Rhizobium laguerreae]
MRLFSIGIATAGALIAVAAEASADDGAVRASCTQAGRIVYREDLPAGTPSDRRLQIAARYRNALCVFLKSDPVETSVEDVHDPALAAVTGGAGGDIASALAYLSPGGEVGTPYGGEEFDEGMKSFMKSENAFTDHVRSVNLTIGVYSGATTEDVLGHWAYIKQNTKLLGRMTPSIERVGDVVVLSVEDVSDEDASSVCKEAQTYASGCMAVY